MKYCTCCGAQLEDDATYCISCGTKVQEKEKTVHNVNDNVNDNCKPNWEDSNNSKWDQPRHDNVRPTTVRHNRIAAGVLNICLPGVGNMYMGYVGKGIAQLILCFCGVGAIWSFIDGILILCGNVATDAAGVPLE